MVGGQLTGTTMSIARSSLVFVIAAFCNITAINAQTTQDLAYGTTVIVLDDLLAGPGQFDKGMLSGQLFSPDAAAAVDLGGPISEAMLPSVLQGIDCRPQCGSRYCCVGVEISAPTDTPQIDPIYQPENPIVRPVFPQATSDVIRLSPENIPQWRYLFFEDSLHSTFLIDPTLGMSERPKCTWCSAPCPGDSTRDCGYVCYRF
jgi:hypothetical protein